MTAPTAWWCPNCGHTVDAPVRVHPCGIVGDHRGTCEQCGATDVELGWAHTCRSCWDSPPDDVYGPGPRFAERAAELGVPPGDDTPTPTAGRHWTVAEVRDVAPPLFDGKAVVAGDVLTVAQERALVALVRRAGATPDLTALPTAEQVERARRSLSALALEVPGVVYDDVKAAWQPVLAAVAALVRSAQNDTDGGTDDG